VLMVAAIGEKLEGCLRIQFLGFMCRKGLGLSKLKAVLRVVSCDWF
jgi:hypothetical protein